MTEEIDEIRRMVHDHEKRIGELEKAIFVKGIKPEGEHEFKGLIGGIQFLISNSFLDTPKSVKEIQEELRGENYHYPYDSISKLLSVDFMSKRRDLTRIKEGNVWKYAVRK